MSQPENFADSTPPSDKSPASLDQNLSTPRAEDRLSRTVITSYAVPTIGVGLMFFLVSLYLMIFATDVLMISPAAL